MAIAEYNAISISLKNIAFIPTTIKSINIMMLPVFAVGLNFAIILPNNSEPPVEAFAFKIIAVPIPIIIPL